MFNCQKCWSQNKQTSLKSFSEVSFNVGEITLVDVFYVLLTTACEWTSVKWLTCLHPFLESGVKRKKEKVN